MTDEEFLPKLREAFAIEAREHVQAMTDGLLELEKTSEPARQKQLTETIYREVHSLKGAAGAVNRTDLQTVCQAMEDVFSQWKRQTVEVAAESFDALSRTVDLIGKLLRQPDVARGAAEQEEIAVMTRRLGELLRTQPAISAAAPPVTASMPETVPAGTPHCASRQPPETDRPASPQPDTVPPPAETPAQDGEVPQLSETVRIRVSKMDSLLRKAEEMVAVKLTARQHALELGELGVALDAWRKEWGKVRDVTFSGLGGQSAATLEKLGQFLEWNQSYMHAFEKRVTTLAGSAARDEHGIGMRVDELLDDAKRLVMLPFGTLLDLLPKMVRDLARAGGKEAGLSIHGREVEIDKRILQEMKDPLIHLVRNSVDHGIEKPAERARAQKPFSGTLTVTVSQRDAGKVEIVVSDDGAGINLDRVKAAAVRSGTLSAGDAPHLDDETAMAHIFDSGVSTSPIITEISGRGLGMAIVREKVEKLGGSIAIESAPGAGTTFRIVIPVTLATFKGILVRAGGQTFVIPTANVWRITRFRREDIQTVENTETMLLDGHAIAFVRLDEVLELTPRTGSDPKGFIEAVVLGAADKRIGFAVDEVLNEQEVLVKNIGKPLLRVRNVAGATVLGSGTPAIILNAADLLKSAVRMAGAGRRLTADATKAPEEAHALRILVTDDSVTSRMLLKNILESSGYQVTTAIDGVDALTALKTNDFDLVVSDVEMPRMDGFDLTAKIRADKKLAELPVVLVTALSSREHQERGIDVGANAYIVKSSFDQSNLLAVIRKLV
jgi:two-component system, chemotaxis family, sensor kinase CheA